MCSIGEDDFGDDGGVHSMEPKLENLNINDASGICQKCNTEPVAVQLGYKEPECKTCFLMYVRHKFRASLGSSKILPKNADVLLIFDGSPSSVTLLDMANFAQTQNTFKRLHCNLKVLVVDDTFLGHQEEEYLKKVLEILGKYDIDTYFTSLASTGPPIPVKEESEEKLRGPWVEEETKLKTMVEKIKTLTLRQDFITNHRKNIIREAALHLNSPFVFLSDISPDLASVFLANISLGRGSSTAHDIALLDERIDNLKLIRPLKDLTGAEVQYYIQFNDLPTVSFRTYGETVGTKMSSIQNLTKSFVENLQEKFPSTVSTVFRTGNKITTKSQLQPARNRCDEVVCRLCRSVIDLEESKTLFAVEFSRMASEFAANGLNDMSSLSEKARQQLQIDNDKQLCHACRNIARNVSSSDVDFESFL
ncbi:unnamed protein product [Hermetia illucens]|uniref:Cytoplasmic tRNA 2-thiolation protein 2 n=1 Tax=Hermetia illucens TaxID=343691 RepID=A0A7R8YTB6_HERIL|nr:cytoplasmic tRNA 2-thiolation protein 2 isoform X3 [Hermetia illucens]CAD7083475.1 unnamed protein product [Hermetia illucens]